VAFSIVHDHMASVAGPLGHSHTELRESRPKPRVPSGHERQAASGSAAVEAPWTGAGRRSPPTPPIDARREIQRDRIHGEVPDRSARVADGGSVADEAPGGWPAPGARPPSSPGRVRENPPGSRHPSPGRARSTGPRCREPGRPGRPELRAAPWRSSPSRRQTRYARYPPPGAGRAHPPRNPNEGLPVSSNRVMKGRFPLRR
jgi:hypothetical protein